MKNHDDEFLKKWAKDFRAGHIFTSDMIQNLDHATLIFIPLMAMADDEHKADLKDAALIYEYYSKAMPRAINGQPMFMSFGMLTKDDVVKVREYVAKLEAAEKAALEDV